MNRIKVLLVEDMEPIRKKYVKVIATAKDMDVVADVGSGSAAVDRFRETRPDVVLMDIEMETPDAGIRAAKTILHCDIIFGDNWLRREIIDLFLH